MFGINILFSSFHFFFAKISSGTRVYYCYSYDNISGEKFITNIVKHNKSILKIYVKYDINNLRFRIQSVDDVLLLNKNLMRIL